MSILQASNLSVRLGERLVLDSVDAGFSTGEITVIVGPNGAGKSTLLSCLCGLRRPLAGEATLDKLPLLSMPAKERARRIGFIPQNPEVAWAIDVLTLVRLGRTPYEGFSGLAATGHAAVEKAMATTATKELADRDVTTLSGGERARAILARALAGEPEWLLADEPFAGLDPRHQLETAGIFRNLAKSEGKGVIITLHDLSLAARIADTAVVLAEGKVAVAGAPEKAFAPDVLAKTYGVRTHIIEGEAGPLIEITGRCEDTP